MRNRRTRYGTFDQSVTLAFISGIDAHPEHNGDDAPPPAPPPEPKRLTGVDRPPRWSDHTIRRMLGKPKPVARGSAQFEQTLSRILGGEV